MRQGTFIKTAFIFVLTGTTFSAMSQPPPPNPQQGNLQLNAVPEPTENPVTEAKRILGKILFWDEQLSSDNTIACGTCHKPAAGGSDNRLARHPGPDAEFFTDDDVIGSFGISAYDSNMGRIDDSIFGHGMQVTNRNSQSVLTAMYADSNFWDGRASGTFRDPLTDAVIISTGGSLESQAIGPILNSVEMAKQGRTWAEVSDKLAAASPLALASNIPSDMANALADGEDYPELFNHAFGDNAITPARIAMAIASYERTLVPDETPWDEFIQGNQNAMTADQISGWESFNNSACEGCHRPPLFSDNSFRNIGLRPATEDIGLEAVSGDNDDRSQFKVPSLRNVGLRNALTHAGWITDVEDAIDFYNSGTNATGHNIFLSATLSGTGGTRIDEIDLFGDDAVRRGQIIDFLQNGLTDPRVAAETFPFDRPTLASETRSSEAFTLGGTDNAARFSFRLFNDNQLSNNSVFTDSDTISIDATITIDESHIGISGELYAVIQYDGRFYMLNEDRSFTSWNGRIVELSPVATRSSLQRQETMVVTESLQDLGVEPGQYRVYVAYVAGTGDDATFSYSQNPALFTISN